MRIAILPINLRLSLRISAAPNDAHDPVAPHKATRLVTEFQDIAGDFKAH